MYAVPTTSQAICIGHFPSGGAGCGSPGPHGLTVDYDDASDGAPWILYGMAGDDVVSLDAVVAGKTHHARLGQNAYVLELPAAQREEPERLILHLRSGATDELPLG